MVLISFLRENFIKIAENVRNRQNQPWRFFVTKPQKAGPLFNQDPLVKDWATPVSTQSRVRSLNDALALSHP